MTVACKMRYGYVELSLQFLVHLPSHALGPKNIDVGYRMNTVKDWWVKDIKDG